MAVKARQVDMTKVKDGGGKFRKTRQVAGDYKAKITKVEDAPKKADKAPQWLFTIKAGAGIYPYYCAFDDNVLWKIRNLFTAAGIAVPKKRVNIDPNPLVGKSIAVTLEDDEYDGKMQSTISATFPLSELDAEDTDDDEGVEEDEAPKKKKAKKPKPAAADDDSDDEPTPKTKKKKKKKKKKSEDLEELDIEDV